MVDAMVLMVFQSGYVNKLLDFSDFWSVCRRQLVLGSRSADQSIVHFQSGISDSQSRHCKILRGNRSKLK